jgi:hypothetical protein
MSDEKVNIELLGARVLTLIAEVRDQQHRYGRTHVGDDRRDCPHCHRMTGKINNWERGLTQASDC